MKRFAVLFTVVVLMVLCAVPVLAAGLSISPPSVEFDVPVDGDGQIEFIAYDFNGNLEVSLEGIPLRVEPTTVAVTAKGGGTEIVLTFYGDESLGSQVFSGKIRFLAMTGGSVAMGIKIRAVVNHVSSVLPEETSAPVEELIIAETPIPKGVSPLLPSEAVTSETVPTSLLPVPPLPAESDGFPVIPVVAIIAATAILITLIVVLTRRWKY